MRRVCVFTGGRADWGLLRWLARDLRDDPAVELRLLVSGGHLCPEFGLTARQIEEDGFTIDARVDMVLAGDSPVATAKAIGLGTIGFADALDRIAPDILVVLGDRYEALAVAQAAMMLRLPIAHIHGGEATEGAIDEAIRHALTKMAHLHFAAAEPYRRRIIQMGEAPDRVCGVGAPGLDNLARLPALDRAGLEAALGFALPAPFFLVTYHPATLSAVDPSVPMAALLDALDEFPEARVLLTKANADTAGRVVNHMIDAYAAARPDRVLATASLGQLRYLSALRLADAVIGNSSSGIIEAPAAATPTVNLGMRQRGRLRAASIIDCAEDRPSIAAAIREALAPSMRARLDPRAAPYGGGGASARIASILRDVPLDGLLDKRFHDEGEAPHAFDANATYREITFREDWKAHRPPAWFDYRRAWDAVPRDKTELDFPIHLDIETTNICNLKCPMCPRTALVERDALGELGMMTREDFAAIIDQGVAHGLKSIKLNYLGEPLGHKDVAWQVAYAKNRGVLDVMMNTNAALLTPERSRALLDAGLDNLFVSFDAIAPDLFEDRRPGTTLGRVIDNVHAFVRLRDAGHPHVQIRLSMVMYDDARWREQFAGIQIMWKHLVDGLGYGLYTERDPDARHVHPEVPGFWCAQPFQRMFLKYNGNVTICCVDDKDELVLGDWRRETLSAIWNGPRYKEIRRRHARGAYYEMELCRKCAMPGGK
ncbi:MAG: UDP-N-acetylglucosamine 2-epimerase (hydrolyzing) [Alphaproteobacteria bacterium]|nr:UDP-N-acetylglucosamine 2-epimerase (hydrolyzing) [Alphaproteobacteria bacterium]